LSRSSSSGSGPGLAFLTGITLLGAEVADALRGRVFAFVQTSARAVLMLAVSASSALVGVGSSRQLQLGTHTVSVESSRVLFFVAGAAGVAVGMAALRQMDDRKGVPVLADAWSALTRRRPAGHT
jgi:dTMP kinase